MHAVMKHWDPMLGVDFHMGYSVVATPPPAPPAPTGPYPFATMQLLSGLYVFFKPLWKQVTLYGVSVEKGTDIGSGIPHIPMMPPVGVIAELPAIIAFSGSKSHFASSTYLVSNKNPALALAVYVNPNLNCGLPVPTPTGVVICYNTHVAGMTWGDIYAGFGSMRGDMAMQATLNLLGMAFGTAFGRWVAGKLGTSATGFIADQAWNVLSFLWGTPVGGSSTNLGSPIVDQNGDPWNPGSTINTAYSSFTEGVARAMGDVLDGNPPQFPVPTILYPAGFATPAVQNVTVNPPPL